jgi:hypothetical protein
MGLLVTSEIRVSGLNVKFKTTWRSVKRQKNCALCNITFLIWRTHIALTTRKTVICGAPIRYGSSEPL